MTGAPIGIFRTEIEGRITEANPALLQMLGVDTLEQANAIGLADLYATPEDRRRLLAAVSEGPVWGSEVEFRRADGQVFAVRLHARMVRDQTSQAHCLEGTFEDLTVERRLQAERRASERLLRDVFDFLPDPTLVVDRQGHVTAWNRAMEALTGIAAPISWARATTSTPCPSMGSVGPFWRTWCCSLTPRRRRTTRTCRALAGSSRASLRLGPRGP